MTPSYSTGFLEAREGDGKHLTLEYRSGKSPGDSPDVKLEKAEQSSWEPGRVDARGSATRS